MNTLKTTKMINAIPVIAVVLFALMAAFTVKAHDVKTSETEVLEAVHVIWDEARDANLEGMFKANPEEHTYIMAGSPFWSRSETLTQYQAMFTGVARQDINNKIEKVTMLSETSALYVADSTFTQYDKDGKVLMAGPYAISIVLEKRNGVWMNIHTHQSFPMGE